MFYFSNYSTKSRYHDDLYNLVMRKIKDVTGGVAIEEFVGLKTKMYPLLVDDKHEDVFRIITVWDIQWIELKVKTIEKELMESTKFHCLVLMTKYILKIMDLMD